MCTGVNLSKIWRANQNIGEQKVLITYVSMGVSQLLGRAPPGCPLKVFSYDPIRVTLSLSCVILRLISYLRRFCYRIICHGFFENLNIVLSSLPYLLISLWYISFLIC